MKKSIKFISILILLAISVTSMDAALVEVRKRGILVDGVTRYLNVIHVWGFYIGCYDPGNETCPGTRPGFISNGHDLHQIDAWEHAVEQIELGVLNGSSILNGTTNVTWEATDVNRTTSLIKVWDNNEPEPDEPIEP